MTKIFANLAALIHLLWVVLGIISLPLLLLLPWWKWVVLIYAVVNVLDWKLANNCTLLQLELYLRKLNNPNGSFEGRGFMEHYLKKYFNLSFTTSTIILSQRIYLLIISLISLLQVIKIL